MKNDVSTPTKSYLLKKLQEASNLLKQKYAEAGSPGQTDEFIAKVLISSNQSLDIEEVVPCELTEHILAFQQSDSFMKTV